VLRARASEAAVRDTTPVADRLTMPPHLQAAQCHALLAPQAHSAVKGSRRHGNTSRLRQRVLLRCIHVAGVLQHRHRHARRCCRQRGGGRA
jgi:hypothetical protein